MIDSKNGSEMGSGNPPGQHSSNYLSSTEGVGGESFVDSKSYRGSANVGRNDSATEVGNQPKENSTASLESRACKEDSI